jgi:hypothetical protein
MPENAGHNSVDDLRQLLHSFLGHYAHIARTNQSWQLQKYGYFLRHYRHTNNILQRARLSIDRECSRGFSVFNYFSCDEMRLSAILADLLDPVGSHGQEALFLGMFIDRLNSMLQPESHLNKEKLESTKIALEVVTDTIESSQRRIDIVVENENWALGIENKPWAGEQDKQLQDYRNHLENKYGSKGIPIHILYLSGDCSMPCSDYDDARTLVMGYAWCLGDCGLRQQSHLDDWLSEAAMRCRSERVRHFLNDFSVWIKKSFTYRHLTSHMEQVL